MRRRQPSLISYSIALLATAAAGLLWALFHERLEPSPIILLVAAETISAWCGGRGPGLLSLGGGVLIFLSLYGSWSQGLAADLDRYGIQVVVFVLVTGLIIFLYTARQSAERALAREALHDCLTGLPNRRLLHDRVERAIASARRGRRSFALVLLDLDNFKEVNDSFGHLRGDLLLQQVGARLRSALRESDTVARLGGDEFALLLPDVDEWGANAMIRKIEHLLRHPYQLDTVSVRSSASMGLALYPQHGGGLSALVDQADSAMYAHKRSKRLHVVAERRAPSEPISAAG